MAIVNRYRGGEGLVVQWIHAGGTVLLNSDYTKLSVDDSSDLIEVTAGNEVDKSYIAGIKDGGASLDFFLTGIAGTAIEAALATNTKGSLVYSPKGTTVGSPKRGFEALVKSLKTEYPYDGAATGSVEFQKTGPAVFGATGVW